MKEIGREVARACGYLSLSLRTPKWVGTAISSWGGLPVLWQLKDTASKDEQQ